MDALHVDLRFDFRFDPPALSDGEAREIAADLYDVRGATEHLRGERSHNTRFTTDEGSQYVLRVASANEPDETIDFHAQALAHLGMCAPTLPVARVVASRTGELTPLVERERRSHRVRLETFLPGVTFVEGQPVACAGLHAIGALLGGVAAALADFAHAAARNFMPWDIANGLALDDALRRYLGPDARPLVERARPRLESAAAAMAVLPRQVIHNDGHAGNLIRAHAGSDEVTGLIDFGDLAHTVTMADLAVSGASFAPRQRDAVAAFVALGSGYHSRRALLPAEVAALADLVLTRLVLTTLMTEYQIRHAPHIADGVARERAGVLGSLDRWLTLDPSYLTERLEQACDP